jgi:anaphase-promoting complex subunit 3
MWQPAHSGRTAEGAAAAFLMLRPLAEGIRHLAMYRCQEAISSFAALVPEQYNTGYVLCSVARAHAEMVDYKSAAQVFEEARAIAPHRLDGIDVYSTVLWHLKEEVKLSHLAQEVQELDRLAPQTWCVIGNCFSLQKEHETALKFFRRAIQLDPKCTYAHTLCGHEYFANEDFEKSMNCYRAALRLDARHYNAWYGLGTVYYRQEKYVMSEYHFRYALNINSKSSVLYCYAGMAKHALNENDEAYALLSHAISMDPKNPLARYEMATVLMSDENYDDALRELQILQEIAPKEASVYFLMGRIHKKLGEHEKAMINFSIALDLRPSNTDVNSIKNQIEKLDSDELSDEDNI